MVLRDQPSRDMERVLDPSPDEQSAFSRSGVQTRSLRKSSQVLPTAQPQATRDQSWAFALLDPAQTVPVSSPVAAADVSKEAKAFACDYCDKSYKYLKDLTRHNKDSVCAKARPSREIIWKCSRCDTRLSNQYSVQRHIESACWKVCDECVAEGNRNCDSQKSDSDCAPCRRNQRPCTKRIEPVEGSTAVLVTKIEDGAQDDQSTTTQSVIVKKRKATISPEATNDHPAKNHCVKHVEDQEEFNDENEHEATGASRVSPTMRQHSLVGGQPGRVPASHEQLGQAFGAYPTQRSSGRLNPEAQTYRPLSRALAYPPPPKSSYLGFQQPCFGRGMLPVGTLYPSHYQTFLPPNAHQQQQQDTESNRPGELSAFRDVANLGDPPVPQTYVPNPQCASSNATRNGQFDMSVLRPNALNHGTLRAPLEDITPTQGLQRPPPGVTNTYDKTLVNFPTYDDVFDWDPTVGVRENLTPAPSNYRPSSLPTTPLFLPDFGGGCLDLPSSQAVMYNMDRAHVPQAFRYPVPMNVMPSAPLTQTPDDPILALRVGHIHGGSNQPFEVLHLRRSQRFGPHLNNYCEKAGKRYLYEWNFVYYYRAPTHDNPKKKKMFILKWNTTPNDVRDDRLPEMRMKNGDVIYVVVRKDRPVGAQSEPQQKAGDNNLGLDIPHHVNHAALEAAHKKQASAEGENHGNDADLRVENQRLRTACETLRKENTRLRQEVTDLREQAGDPTFAQDSRPQLPAGDLASQENIRMGSTDSSPPTAMDDGVVDGERLYHGVE